MINMGVLPEEKVFQFLNHHVKNKLAEFNYSKENVTLDVPESLPSDLIVC